MAVHVHDTVPITLYAYYWVHTIGIEQLKSGWSAINWSGYFDSNNCYNVTCVHPITANMHIASTANDVYNKITIYMLWLQVTEHYAGVHAKPHSSNCGRGRVTRQICMAFTALEGGGFCGFSPHISSFIMWLWSLAGGGGVLPWCRQQGCNQIIIIITFTYPG